MRVKQTTEVTEKVVTQTVKVGRPVYTVTLEQDEADALASMLGKTGGHGRLATRHPNALIYELFSQLIDAGASSKRFGFNGWQLVRDNTVRPPEAMCQTVTED